MDTQNYQFRGPTALENQAIGREEGREEGLHAGTVASILRVLEARGLEPSPDQRARIVAEQDLLLLETWVTHAVTTDSVADLFLG